MNNNFKVMFVFFNDRMRTFIPTSISYLSAELKAAGFSTCLFDTSFYSEQERLMEERKKEDAGIFEPVDYKAIGVKLNNGNIQGDLLEVVEREKPQLIGFSIFSQSADINFSMAEAIKTKYPSIPIIMGGIHINIYPEKVLGLEFVDYICLGEGEEPIVELAEYLYRKTDISQIKNIGYKRDGKLHINPVRPPMNLDKLNFPDWELFQPYHQYGPFRGRLLKMALVECTRTCPYSCAFCGNDIIKRHYKNAGESIHYRHKSPKKWVGELKKMKEEYGTEFINIIDSTFVAQPESVFSELAELYAKEIALPFFCDASVNCFTTEKARCLKEMGCVCVNMGIEAGNEEYRHKILKKRITNKKIIESFHLVREFGIETRAYNIIGLPFHTRENIMETIELNRKAKVGSISLSIFMPYDGTPLRDYCIEHKLVDPDVKITGDGTEPIIRNPNLTDQELMGLYNTFFLYVMAPRGWFPEIKKAEADTTDGARIRKEIHDRIIDARKDTVECITGRATGRHHAP